MYGINRSAVGMPWRINLSSRAAELRGGDAIVVSIPKSGRTWLRTFLSAYFCARYEHPFSLDLTKYRDPRIPQVIYSHDLFEHRTKGRWWDRARGKYLIPANEIRRTRIILLARDPRDAFVSHYVQLTRPTADAPDEVKTKTAGEMLRDPLLGIGQIVRTMNDWLVEFGDRPNVTLVRYEDLRSRPAEHFGRVLAAMGEQKVSQEHLNAALRFSEFSNMKKLEAAGAFDSKILQPRDMNDLESFNVRRGKVGGYREYLSTDDQKYAADALRELHPRFGYNC
jgi:sulfotransferase family protein